MLNFTRFSNHPPFNSPVNAGALLPTGSKSGVVNLLSKNVQITYMMEQGTPGQDRAP